MSAMRLRFWLLLRSKRFTCDDFGKPGDDHRRAFSMVLRLQENSLRYQRTEICLNWRFPLQPHGEKAGQDHGERPALYQ